MILNFFTALGIVCAVLILFGIVYSIKEWISGLISDWKWEWKYKHRFDKKPTAKCYCKDCYHYDREHNKCRGSHANEYFTIADNSFCWRAEPLKRDPERRKK